MVTKKEKNFVSAVVYLHNEEAAVADFVRQIHATLLENFEQFEIICVNDASSDASAARVKETAKELPGGAISIVNLSFFQGQEAAMNAGIDLAIGDFVFEFERCYIDYAPQTVMDVYFHSLKGFDIVCATNGKGRLSAGLFYRLFNRSSGAQYRLGAETFRVLSRRAINRVRAMSTTVPYRKALYASCGLKVDTLTYEPQNPRFVPDTREQGRMKQDTALTSLILFTDVAYKLSIAMTVLMMLAAVGGGVYTLGVFLLGKPVAGYTTTMMLLAGCFFGVFAILAIVIKYLSVLVDLAFRRQPYIVESIEKIAR